MRVTSPYGVAIFCDDIRAELGGKFSLMGIFLERMILEDQIPENEPVIIPRLGICINLVVPHEYPPYKNAKLRIISEFESTEQVLIDRVLPTREMHQNVYGNIHRIVSSNLISPFPVR